MATALILVLCACSGEPRDRCATHAAPDAESITVDHDSSLLRSTDTMDAALLQHGTRS